MGTNRKNLATGPLISLGLAFGTMGALGQDQRAPAPWNLEGEGYVILSSVSKSANLQNGFIQESMKSRFRRSFGMVMLVDYHTSPVGPYKELLYMPGTFEFDDGQTHASISKIFVSSLASVINGRRNWGIPKELADFSVEQNSGSQETITVSQSSQVIAKFTLASQGPKFPLSTKLIPIFFMTLGQSLEGKTYTFAPSGRGWAQHAKVIDADSDPEFFPGLSLGKVLMAVKVRKFTLEFPQAKIQKGTPASDPCCG